MKKWFSVEFCGEEDPFQPAQNPLIWNFLATNVGKATNDSADGVHYGYTVPRHGPALFLPLASVLEKPESFQPIGFVAFPTFVANSLHGSIRCKAAQRTMKIFEEPKKMRILPMDSRNPSDSMDLSLLFAWRGGMPCS